jgi:hypothetical protein
MKSLKSIGTKPQSPLSNLEQELRKVEVHIQNVSNRLTDCELEIGTSVRLSVELRELEAYLRGIRFAIGQAPPWDRGLEAEA